jgi:YVTN family beta-propeller protein
VAADAATRTVYVANAGAGTVSVIDGVTNTVSGSPLPVGTDPDGVAVDPATDTVYVVSVGSTSSPAGAGSISVIAG